MALFPYPHLDTLTPALRVRLAALETDSSQIPNLFRLLAHHEASATTVLNLGESVNGAGILGDRRMQELTILRTVYRCGDEFEWGRHTARARALGLPDDLVNDLVNYSASARFTAAEQAALRLADTLCVGIPTPEQLERARQVLGDSETVAVVVLCAIYVMVARVNLTFAIDPHPGDEPLPAQALKPRADLLTTARADD